MADISTYINSETGDYVIQNGVLINSNSLLAEIFFCLDTPLGSYIYDLSLGNDILNYSYGLPEPQIMQLLENALSPLTSTNRLKNVNIKILVALQTTYSVMINCTDNTGQPIQLKWTKLNG